MKIRDAYMTEFERDIFYGAAAIIGQQPQLSPEGAVRLAFKVANEVIKQADKEILAPGEASGK
jgi:hypothetical protein